MQPRHVELLGILTRHGVPFVVIGGNAVTFHGHVRTTEDLDVIWLRSAEAEAALLAALTEVNAAWISNEIDRTTGLEKLVPVGEGYVRSARLMVLVTDKGFLDVFDYVPGHPDADVLELFNESIPSAGVRYVSLNWLKEMKRAAGRPRDNEDLENLP
jgi:hypothetical protein